MSDNYVICKLCFSLYETKADLVVHQLNRHSDNKLICRPCDAHFVTLNGLMVHTATFHGAKEPKVLYYCSICTAQDPLCEEYEAFDSRQLLIEHYTATHTSSIITDGTHFDIPKAISETPVWDNGAFKLKIGPLEPGDGYPYFVLQPYRVVGYPPAGKKIRLAKPYHCPHCETYFSQSAKYKMHARRYFDNLQNYECDMCHRMYISGKRLRHHKRKYHGEFVKPETATEKAARSIMGIND